jgi:hypothetical protein
MTTNPIPMTTLVNFLFSSKETKPFGHLFQFRVFGEERLDQSREKVYNILGFQPIA